MALKSASGTRALPGRRSCDVVFGHPGGIGQRGARPGGDRRPVWPRCAVPRAKSRCGPIDHELDITAGEDGMAEFQTLVVVVLTSLLVPMEEACRAVSRCQRGAWSPNSDSARHLHSVAAGVIPAIDESQGRTAC